ncbi:protein NLRC3 [Rhipicephalus sanguineus]|uniref:protein NLRC3 n=1 Tax=Rhipicephalus sanguineus TaxID=34632 RepID=UPI001894D911|nr:protein NLRC3 [Rhipicephalus sanguineus]
MESRASFLGDIKGEIPCVDYTRLFARIKSISLKCKACGVDLDKPCGKTAENASRCWITFHLRSLNEALRDVGMHVFEHAPGKFALGTFPDVYTEYEKSESTLLESVTLVYWLLREHRCVTRLDLGDAAVLFCNFPALLCTALRQNKGLEEVRLHPKDVRGVWRETRAMIILSSTVGKLSLALDALDINELTPTIVSLGGIAEAVGKGSLRRLVISNGASSKIARRLFRAVGWSTSLSELEVRCNKRLPLFSAAILSDALKRNRTLRKLTIEWLEKDAVGTLLKSLKENATLEELVLIYSYDEPNHILWDGFEALRVNRGLKSIKLVGVSLVNSCAITVADILRQNDVLREVSLSDNSIGDLGAGALAKALLKNSTLKRLDISECMCSYDGLSSFLKSLSLNTTVECIRLGDIDVPESWSPSSPLDASVCARLDVTWNTRGLQDWASSLRQGGEHHFPRLCVGWTKDTASSGIVEWFDAVRAIGASITELVISCPEGVGQECGDAAASFLETTCSLKKLTVNVKDRCCSFVNAIIRGLARNKSVSEAKFLECYLIDQLTKALQDLMRTNRTLHRLEFKAVYLKERAVRSLARALEDNFVLLTFDLEYTPDVGMHLIFSVLDRNRSLLSRAVECVLNASAEEESIRALQLLSLTDSLIDAVVEVSGKDREECRILVQESVRRL